MPSLPLSRLLMHTAEALYAVRSGRSLNEALARCPNEARPGTQALAFHVIRHLGWAQAARRQLVTKAPPPLVDALICVALALLWHGDKSVGYAPHTLVNQAVEAAKQCRPGHVSFVNAVLRRFLRESEAVISAVQADPVALYNHPQWWIERLRCDWPQAWQLILRANNQHPPMTLRVNARRDTPLGYVQRLVAAGLEGAVVGPQAVRMLEACPVEQLPGFAAGDVSVQDAAAQWAASLLIGAGLPAGARVLDACAAPGGKTAHLLELAELDVLALDSDAGRLQRVDETLSRLGLGARTLAADARYPDTWWDGQPFEAILLDAPCSASGIVRRHPDVRWLRRPGDIPALAQTQAKLLDALWPLLKSGGRMLYATCSVFKAEGQDVIHAFLQRQPGATLADRPLSPGHFLPTPEPVGKEHEADSAPSPDGFFYALLVKG